MSNPKRSSLGLVRTIELCLSIRSSDVAVAMQPAAGGVITLAPQETFSVQIPIVSPSVVYVRIVSV